MTFRFTAADGWMVEKETLTSGMVGKEVKLEFSSDWDNLKKTAVFTAGSVTRDVVDVSNVVEIPAEVLAKPLQRLYVGVYGVSEDGKKVMPTIRAEGPKILPGANPSGDESTDSVLPVWAQLDQRVTKLEQNSSEAVLYVAQELTDEQQAQARENIGAATVEEVETYLEGSDTGNLLAYATWEEGYYYNTGGASVVNNVYDGLNYRTKSYIPVTPGQKYTFYIDAPTDRSTEYTQRTISCAWCEYDSSGAFIQRIYNAPLTGSVTDGVEHVEIEYTVPENVSSIRVYTRTWGYNPAELVTMYIAGTNSAQRLLPVVSSDDNGKTLVARDGKWIAGAVETGAPALLDGTTIAEKCSEFAILALNAGISEGFVFFTDPHPTTEAVMREQMYTLETYYNAIPAPLIVCGGDWLRNQDIQKEACRKLAYYYAWLRRVSRDRNICVGANHDTNEYGVDDAGNTYSGMMPYSTVRNLMARGEDNVYYAYDGGNTRFYALDTASESDRSMTAYHWEQIAWLADMLKSDNPENAAIVHHAVYCISGDSYIVTTFTDTVTQLCNAYNNATTITLNGTTYDFTGCAGCVRFVLGGHIHQDIIEVHNGIPVISTLDMQANGSINFDLCHADYENNTLHLIRVGTGENRQVTMAPNGATNDDGGNLFDINNLMFAADNTYHLQTQYLPKVENGVLYSGGISGVSAGPVMYVAVSPGNVVEFSADVSGSGKIEIWAISDPVDQIYSTSTRLEQISVGDNSLAKTYTIPDGMTYFGFKVYSTAQYAMQLTNIVISN